MTKHLAQDGASTPVATSPISWPPLTGPGSDKEAWVAFSREVAKGNEEAWEVVDEQTALIATFEAELAQLRAGLAEREATRPQPAERDVAAPKAKVSRRKTSEQTKEAILADLAAGLSQSQAAVRNGVLAMTVSRMVRSA